MWLALKQRMVAAVASTAAELAILPALPAACKTVAWRSAHCAAPACCTVAHWTGLRGERRQMDWQLRRRQ